jgi:hypothetical protein
VTLRGLETKTRRRVVERFTRELVSTYLAKAVEGAKPNPVSEIVKPLRDAGYSPVGIGAALDVVQGAHKGSRTKRNLIFDSEGRIVGIKRSKVANDPGTAKFPTVEQLVEILLGRS